MRACWGPWGPTGLPVPKVNPTPPPARQSPAYGQEQRPSLRLVEAGRGFMRDVLLRMAEHFNDWDLQAVVRSCGGVAHAGPQPEPADAATAPAAPRGDEAPERVPGGARSTPAVSIRGQERAPPPPVAAKAAALLCDLEYLDSDHEPFLLPVAPSPRPRVGGGGHGREVMISFPAGAASTSGVQQRASSPRRRPGARTPRPKRRYRSRTDAVRSAPFMQDSFFYLDLFCARA
jgi:WRKY transcription factor 22